MANQQTVKVICALALSLALLCNQMGQVQTFQLVETGVSALSPDGVHVGVNVPAIFNMDLDTRGLGKGLRLSQSVLSGLVKIFIDRESKGDGSISRRGPIRVTVGGVTMYDNQAPPIS